MVIFLLPLLLPLSGQDVLNEAVHAYCTFFVHLVGDMAINIQSKSGGGMAQISLDRFDVITGAEGCNCESVPLRYNYDKPEKPRISRVFGYQARFFILFQPEKSSREVVIS